MKNADSSFSANIMQWVNNKQFAQQHTVYMDWWYREKPFYKICRTVNVILLWLTFVLNFFIIYGDFYKLADLQKSKNAVNEAAALRNSAYSFVFATVLLIVGYVFFIRAAKTEGGIKRRKRTAAVSFIFECAGCVIGAAAAVGALVSNRISNMYATSVDGSTLTRINFELFGYHIVPLALILITSLLIFVMFTKESKDREMIYSQVTDELYRKYTKDNPDYSEKTWNEYLENYNPSAKK